ncbi:RnfABCDGE type electron transport complex subunit B [Agaribacterium haliotis]|uniref:RnfABCDGE type electron transport complex subunit B n=1 Tax=Agaribacterium haliotis TaxID=2013869 RepID=UPI001EFEC31C|nr:RnfABCDGE type electron transport complex subunit B [Agaribacterium haliotis]
MLISMPSLLSLATSVMCIAALGALLGLLLALAGKYFGVDDESPLVKEIVSLLPGSQCGQCGYLGCADAAKSLVDGEVGINFCPPGGRALVDELASLMGVDARELGELAKPQLAQIDEKLCVGCTRCLKACPTDAIVGASGQIHVVLVEACSGCKLCLSRCPEDCISLKEEKLSLENWAWPKPQLLSHAAALE